MARRLEATVSREWLTPLDTGARADWDSLVVTRKGAFLAERAAYRHLTGHVHTGVDYQNRAGRGGPGEPVYATARGKVWDVKVQGAGTRVTVAHLLPDGEIVYSSYIHVGGVRVRRGTRVGPHTVIARRLKHRELARYGSLYNHLHFQIHRGRFVPEHTIATRTDDEARARFYDPQIFGRRSFTAGPFPWMDWIREGRISFGMLLWLLF